MKIGNLNGRTVLVQDGRALDIERASGGRLSADPQRSYEQWTELRRWAAGADYSDAVPFAPAQLKVPVPHPRQVIAIGVNYRDHAAEAGLPIPERIVVFTKFQSSLGDPNVVVELPSDFVDYETELVVVMGQECHQVPVEAAWSRVAGLAVGQDYSERKLQLAGTPPQFSLGKSYPNFAPFGPLVVTPDELADPDALDIRAELLRDGAVTVLQEGNTRDMVFTVPEIIAQLTAVMTLYPGDVIFTGTPAGVGMGRDLYLRAGDALTSTITGLGQLRNSFVGVPALAGRG